MQVSKIIRRLSFVPFAFIKGMIILINEVARDLENKKRYPNAKFETGVKISTDSIIGENVFLSRNVIFNHSHIGQYSYINFDSLIQHTRIGNYCSIAHGVKIGLGAHPTDKFSTSPIFYRQNNPLGVRMDKLFYSFQETQIITIGNDVWIGANAIIMDGITIGNGAIIAAGAVVTKDIPPYSIVGGVPAKILRFRFSPEEIKKLQESQWWLKRPEELNHEISTINKMV